ncbi:MAG: tetratricopeptide repeat protein, partial [Planctomycetota bacterium]
DLDAGRPMGNRELRSVPYATFYGREYAWGWALVRFLRRDEAGRRWKPFIKFMRTVSGVPPSDSECRRFLRAVGFRDDAALDLAWHAHLLAARAQGGFSVPMGTSDEALAEVERLEKPTPEQARTFARIGESFAEKGLARPAVVYLRAAVRGGVAGPAIHRALATALARVAGCDADEPWPEEAVDHLRKAVEAEPLRAASRRDLGRQLLLHAKTDAQILEARNQLGLALLLAGPDDDVLSLAIGALRGVVAADRSLSPGGAAKLLTEVVPEAAAAVRTAHGYFLQEEELWDDLVEVIQERVEAGVATFEDRKMLAGLYRAGDRLSEAAAIYAGLLEEAPDALHLWLPLVATLVEAGRTEDAAKAREEALAAIDASSGDHEALRRRILEIEPK